MIPIRYCVCVCVTNRVALAGKSFGLDLPAFTGRFTATAGAGRKGLLEGASVRQRGHPSLRPLGAAATGMIASRIDLQIISHWCQGLVSLEMSVHAACCLHTHEQS